MLNEIRCLKIDHQMGIIITDFEQAIVAALGKRISRCSI